MSGKTVADFLAYWSDEGERYAQAGDYDWMASLIPGHRVLEIGCGLGFGTEAMLRRGLVVLALDSLRECLASTQQRVGTLTLETIQAEVSALDDDQREFLEKFAPDTIVCWLMGAPAETTGAQTGDGGRAVVAYREQVHRAVAELAVQLPSVRYLHFVDRTAIPWQAKDIGRDTLVNYHAGKTLAGLPFQAQRSDALYRKLGSKVVDLARARPMPPSMKSVVPTLASLLAKRKD